MHELDRYLQELGSQAIELLKNQPNSSLSKFLRSHSKPSKRCDHLISEERKSELIQD